VEDEGRVRDPVFPVAVSNVGFGIGTDNAMRHFAQSVIRFLVNEDGPTAVEYAVMLALIIVVCITAITTLGTNANATFSYVATQVGTTAS
jgi:pilus assembly protein Flp/PilA